MHVLPTFSPVLETLIPILASNAATSTPIQFWNGSFGGHPVTDIDEEVTDNEGDDGEGDRSNQVGAAVFFKKLLRCVSC